jgi:hypothetical protein
MTRFSRTLALLIPCALYGTSVGMAATLLGSAQDFAVLGASTVTNTGSTTITGDLGVWPGSSITGLSGISLTGTVHAGDAAAQLAQNDTTAAVTAINAFGATNDLSGLNLGGMTLTPGGYFFSSSAQLTGTLTLDAQGNDDARFVFLTGTSLTTDSGSIVNVINGNATTSVYFRVGSSATLGTSTSFAGNIIADQSITLNTSATICGRAIAQNGAVTMDGNVVSNDCGTNDFDSKGFSGAGVQAVPEPGTFALVGALFIGVAASRMRVARNRRTTRQ